MNETQIAAASIETNRLPDPLRSVVHAAIAERATDVHLDASAGEAFIRFRVDGILHRKRIVSSEASKRLVNQVKVAANLNTDRSFRPLESNITLRGTSGSFNIRVSIIPVGSLETAHLRFLAVDSHVLDIHSLGLFEANNQRICDVLRRGQGLVIVAGGTGTGKTTTMYALANVLDLEKNVVASIEDPVEFRFPGIRQLEVDVTHGLDMQEGLRVLLRMDPDVVLVGEIRDPDSAATAARAALAGRLVIATLHARDAAMAVDALKHYSVPRYVLGGALRLVITQELMRRVCGNCARQRSPDSGERAAYERHGLRPPEAVVQATGCQACDEYGYAGRIGIFEVTPIGDALAEEISRGGTQRVFRRLAASEGCQTLAANALQKAAEGTVSIEEALKLCFSRTPSGKRGEG